MTTRPSSITTPGGTCWAWAPDRKRPRGRWGSSLGAVLITPACAVARRAGDTQASWLHAERGTAEILAAVEALWLADPRGQIELPPVTL